MRNPSLLIVSLTLLTPGYLSAQSSASAPQTADTAVRPPVLLMEGATGLARFVDDAPIEYAYFGGSSRLFATSRIAVGPEFIYLTGPDGAHQWHLTGNVTFDLVQDGSRDGVQPRVVPYIVASGGYQRMTTRVGTGPFTSSEGSVSGGGGARVALGERLFVAPEFRLGWELHYRFGATIGARF